MTANAEPECGLEPLPVPSPRSPHTHPAGPPPALTVSLCRPWSEAAAGRSAASAPRLENPRPAGGARASRLPAPCSASSALWPPPPPPPRSPPASRAAQSPGRGQGRGAVRDCACVSVCARAAQRAARAGQPDASGLSGCLGVHTGACPAARARVCLCVFLCVSVCGVREGARWGGYTCESVPVRVRVHAACAGRLGMHFCG